jgi:hypothetical protein
MFLRSWGHSNFPLFSAVSEQENLRLQAAFIRFLRSSYRSFVPV